MLAIGLGAAFYVFGNPNRILSALLAGFLLTQAVFGLCVVTLAENAARTHYGYEPSESHFIISGILTVGWMQLIARVVFGILGAYILAGILTNKRRATQ